MSENETKLLQAKKDVREFFEILDTVEESDMGREFHPVYISSCRVLTSVRLQDILSRLRKWSEAVPQQRGYKNSGIHTSNTVVLE